MTRVLFLSIVAVSLLAAGCIGGAPTPVKKSGVPPTDPTAGTPPSSDPATQAPPAPRLNLTRFNGSVAGAFVQGFGYVSPSEKHVFDVNVTNGTRALLIEVSWRGGDKLSLKADVPAQYCKDTDPLGFLVSCPSPKPNDEGVSPARILVTDAATLARSGTWQVSVWAQGSTNEVPFTAVATTFLDSATPPQGYSALPPS